MIRRRESIEELSAITAAGVVLYSPNKEFVRSNVNKLLGQVERIILIDNTPEPSFCFDDDWEGRVVYVANHANFGIARALNQIFELANDEQFKWVLTLDQDSIVPSDIVVKYQDILNDLGDLENVSIVCPSIYEPGPARSEGQEGWVDRCITSGSLNRVSAWLQVEGFDEYLFIDYVDYDYCFRLRDNGWLIYQSSRVVLTHEIGKRVCRHFFLKKVYPMHHPPFRKYFQIRNGIYCTYKQGGSYRVKAIGLFLNHFLLVLYEDNKLDKTKAMVSGLKDAFKKLEVWRCLTQIQIKRGGENDLTQIGEVVI